MTIEELNDHEHIFLLLNLLTKFYKSDLKLNDRKYLGASLPNRVKWGEIISWDDTAYYLLQRKKLEEYRRLSNQSLSSHRNLTSDQREREFRKNFQSFNSQKYREKNAINDFKRYSYSNAKQSRD